MMDVTKIIELAARLANALYVLQNMLILNSGAQSLRTLAKIIIDLMDELKRELLEVTQ